MLSLREISVVVLLAALGLSAGEAPVPSENGTTPSETLIAPAREMLNEIFVNMKSERRLPPTITDSELAARVNTNIDALKGMHIFDATPEQEAAFKKGAFDDKKNLEQLGSMIEFLKKSKTDLPATTVYAMRHFDAKDLKGVRLEMCVRAVNYNVAKLRAMMGESESPAKRSKP